jgi:hypothetical protein
VTTFVTLPVGHEKLSSALQQRRRFRIRPSLEPGRMKAMQLKHLNLTTSDVSDLAAFFERFFGFKRLVVVVGGDLLVEALGRMRQQSRKGLGLWSLPAEAQVLSEGA